jgi:membrane dipeptidase
MTLTHTFHTNWADSGGSFEGIEPKHHGLTELGREIVREMNRLGMMVDISHVSDATFFQALELSEAPLIASHSSCRALCLASRNMTDEMIRALASKGGVIQINFFPAFIDEECRKDSLARTAALKPKLAQIDREHASDLKRREEEREKLLSQVPMREVSYLKVVEHIEHVIKLVGPDHVGLGADWDGIPTVPKGMEDCSKLPQITIELLRRGHREEDVRKVLGENLLRVLEACEKKASEIREREYRERVAKIPLEK